MYIRCCSAMVLADEQEDLETCRQNFEVTGPASHFLIPFCSSSLCEILADTHTHTQVSIPVVSVFTKSAFKVFKTWKY